MSRLRSKDSSKAAWYLLLRLDKFIPRQILQIWPGLWRRRAHDLVYHVQLVDLVLTLKDRSLGEKLEKDTSSGDRQL